MHLSPLRPRGSDHVRWLAPGCGLFIRHRPRKFLANGLDDCVGDFGALEDIGTAVKRVTDVVTEIAHASQTQASGIEQVNKAVKQMDVMTQQNAALVEEASAASESIVQQAAQLAELVGRYDLEVESACAVPVAKHAPKAASTPDSQAA